MNRAAVLVLAAALTGCHKNHPLLGIASTPAPTYLAIGAGQSNMANMNLADFQKNAPNVARTYNGAVGGSALSEWTKGTDYYQNRILHAFQVSNQPVSVVLWWQGEAEGLSGIDYLTWGERFTQFVHNVRADTHTNVRFIVVRLGAVPDGTPPTAWDSIRDQQAALAIPGVTVVNVDDIPRTNGVHYTPDAYATIAARLAAAYQDE
jgi:hypothetical protein